MTLYIELWKVACPELRAAVKTMKKNINKISNFGHLFSNNIPNSHYKIAITNNEYSIRKIKDVLKH
ncbi:MAG: hypothetical protein ACTSRG_12435 [Candidatus Helarchaeota archaeon]